MYWLVRHGTLGRNCVRSHTNMHLERFHLNPQLLQRGVPRTSDGGTKGMWLFTFESSMPGGMQGAKRTTEKLAGQLHSALTFSNPKVSTLDKLEERLREDTLLEALSNHVYAEP